MPFVFEIPRPEAEIKIKVSLPESLVNWAKSEADPKGGTVEQFVVSALRHLHQQATQDLGGGPGKRPRKARNNPAGSYVQG
jgi:hypothetical protein